MDYDISLLEIVIFLNLNSLAFITVFLHSRYIFEFENSRVDYDISLLEIVIFSTLKTLSWIVIFLRSG